MKKIILTLFVITYSLGAVAQNDRTGFDIVYINGHNSNFNTLSSFILDVASEGKFKYRKFLRKEKKINKTFQIGKQKFTTKKLAKLIRKGARISENLEVFEAFLISENPLFTSFLSNNDLAFLYQKFREGTVDNYLDDLAASI